MLMRSRPDQLQVELSGVKATAMNSTTNFDQLNAPGLGTSGHTIVVKKTVHDNDLHRRPADKTSSLGVLSFGDALAIAVRYATLP